MNIQETFGIGLPDELPKGEFVAGIECELEGVALPIPIEGFFIEKDGSLRGNGYEYISIPFTKVALLEKFKELHSRLEFIKGEDPFSPRTSTHVHVNCAFLGFKEVRTIVLLYALFEEFFFMMVKPIRRDNIHCVPLTETHLPNLYRRGLDGMVDRWHKYTALNIKPLREIGTIEFRHLHGTGDVAELSRWLDVLERLWLLGQRVEINTKTLTNKQHIQMWFSDIFAGAPSILAYRESLFDIIKNSLIDVKFSTI